MAGVKGINCFLVARYVVFGLFTTCNAITCSVAVWNSSLVRSTQPLQIDIYLIFLGAFSLVSIFTLIFVELLCTNVVTTHVWFECAWVALFWVMELAGGAALTAVESDTACSREATVFLDALCTSERVLLAFTWICTIMLLVYLLTLVFIVASQHHEAPKIWVSDVRALRAAAGWQYSSGIPNSPLGTRLKKRASVDVYTPQPVRSQLDRHHRGLNAKYEIERFRPVFVGSEQMDAPHSLNLPGAIPLSPLAAATSIPLLVNPTLPKDTGNARSLSLGQSDLPHELASSIVYSSSARLPSRPVASEGNRLPSPTGDWPRRDVMQLPARPMPRHKLPLPRAPEFAVTADRADPSAVTQPRPRRPSGPRMREVGRQPTPSGISNYETGRRQ